MFAMPKINGMASEFSREWQTGHRALPRCGTGDVTTPLVSLSSLPKRFPGNQVELWRTQKATTY